MSEYSLNYSYFEPSICNRIYNFFHKIEKTKKMNTPFILSIHRITTLMFPSIIFLLIILYNIVFCDVLKNIRTKREKKNRLTCG